MLETNFPTWAFSTHPFIKMFRDAEEDSEDLSRVECVYALAFNAFHSIKCLVFVVPQYFFDTHNFTLTTTHLGMYYEITKLALRVIVADDTEEIKRELVFARAKNLISSLFIPYDNTEFHLQKFRLFNPVTPNFHLNVLSNIALIDLSVEETKELFRGLNVDSKAKTMSLLKFLIEGSYKESIFVEKEIFIEDYIFKLVKKLYKEYGLMTIEVVPSSDDETAYAAFIDKSYAPVLEKVLKLGDTTNEDLEETDFEEGPFEVLPEDYDETILGLKLFQGRCDYTAKGVFPLLKRFVELGNGNLSQFVNEFFKEQSLTTYGIFRVFETWPSDDLNPLLSLLEFAKKNNFQEMQGKIAWILIANVLEDESNPGYITSLRPCASILVDSIPHIRIFKCGVSCFEDDEENLQFKGKGDLVYAENLHYFCKKFTTKQWDCMQAFDTYAKKHLKAYKDDVWNMKIKSLRSDYIQRLQSIFPKDSTQS